MPVSPTKTETAATATATVDVRELVITRRFEAPRARVFEAWTDPEEAKAWWGPRDYPLTYLEMDVREGGSWRGRLTSTANGEALWQSGVIREIHPPDRLAFTFAWDRKDQGKQETLVTVTLEEDGEGTLMTFRQSPFDSDEDREGHRGGWSSSFDRLDEYLAKRSKEEPKRSDNREEIIMLGNKNAVATVAVKDIQTARRFYEDKLGLKSDGKDDGKKMMNGNITYKTGGTSLLVYTSQFAGTNQATSATWSVGGDFDEIVKALQSKGVIFEHYDNLPGLAREGDVHRAEGLKLAWFKDPDGNIHHLISL